MGSLAVCFFFRGCNSERIESSPSVLVGLSKRLCRCNSERIERETAQWLRWDAQYRRCNSERIERHIHAKSPRVAFPSMQLRKNWKCAVFSESPCCFYCGCNSERIERYVIRLFLCLLFFRCNSERIESYYNSLSCFWCRTGMQLRKNWKRRRLHRLRRMARTMQLRKNWKWRTS